ncbi:MAG: hypothetical protein QOE69_3067 [Thermoleophilaceae bacterium]|jgi:DNA-binding MarR family transcriptional regulator|nr:hypothetical protein [Thermoleophilaceae bacterium]MEA2408948.1 hypothetical protein [Thermoleophilaceae bacterium]
MRLVRTPRLDFIVIGAQKAGTTSLWRYLEDNEALRMPPDKEASFFSEPAYPGDLRAYMRALFKDAPHGTKLGTVTPVYMHGTPTASVPAIADRIHEAVPGVKLVALLRDPVERARSAHRMLARRGVEQRSFTQAIDELLQPGELERARREPEETRSYVVAGEYGRMLAAYSERFGRERLHVELASELDRAPAGVVRRVCEFIGVEPHEPRLLGERFYPSGRPRVSGEAERDLKDYLERNVWARMRHGEQHRESFKHWFELWNVVPDPASEEIDPRTAERLRAHYEDDQVLLAETIGLRV